MSLSLSLFLSKTHTHAHKYTHIHTLAHTQECALGALAGMLKLDGMSVRTSNELLAMHGIRPLLTLLKEGYPRLQVKSVDMYMYVHVCVHIYMYIYM